MKTSLCLRFVRGVPFLVAVALAVLLAPIPARAGVAPWRANPAVAGPPAPFESSWISFNTGLVSTEGSPFGLATGDVDGDGDMDVVAARAYRQGGFVFMRNEGGGQFAAPISVGAGGQSYAIILADLDNDRDLDVVVSDSDGLSAGTSISVYLNDGTGNFGARQVISLGTGSVVPAGLAAADFDGDGDQDLAVAGFGFNATGTNCFFLRNNGNATFAAPVTYAVSDGPSDLAVGDMNGDGRPDLVVGHQPYAVSVLINNGTGGFAPPFLYPNLGVNYAANSATCVALADLDRDGDLDVLYGNTRTWDGTTGHVVQLRNSGGGLLTRGADLPFANFSAGPSDLAAADLNGDGAPDLVAAVYNGRAGDGVYVSLNNGAGDFGAATLHPAGQYTSGVAAADLNGDGKVDVLSGDSGSMALTVRLNPGNGVFPVLREDFAAFGQRFQDAADVDGDGDLDLFTSGPHPSAAEGTILQNDGAGHFTTRTVITNGQEGVTAGVLRDLNGDGKPDLLFNNANSSTRYDFFTAMNNGNGTFATPVRWPMPSAGWGEVDAFDLDNDGDLDVVDMEAEGAPNIPDGRFFVALNNGNGTFAAPMVYDQLPGRTEDVVAGDFNHDGKLDLAITNNGTYGFDARIFVVLGNGNGTFGAPLIYTIARGPLYLVTADFDGDDNLDLATLRTGYDNSGAEGVTVLFGSGMGTFIRAANYYAPYSPDLLGASGITSGDVDGDGDLDLMTTGSSNDVAIYYNDGAGVFSFPYRLGAFAGTHWPLFADFTGDGVADLAVLSSRPPLGFDSGVGIMRGTQAAPLAVTSVVSRKAHGTAGTFDLDLPLTGTPAVEMRGGNHTLVAIFSSPVSSGNAAVSSGNGSVSSATVSGNTLIVDLANVADRQTLTVTLSNVTSTTGQALPSTAVSVNFLFGDVSGNGAVNSSDVGSVKANVGVAPSQANFRSDVTANGSVNSSDVGAVKAASGAGA